MLTGSNYSGFGLDPDRKTVTAEKPMWEVYLNSHKEELPFKTKAFPYYDDLCMVFGKDRATDRGAEAAADVIEELKKEAADDINIDDDCFNDIHNTTYVDEAQSMSFSQASAISQTQAQFQGSSKRKMKSTNNAEAYEAIEII
ncbi:uncharacterized protein At2g29880-like isoform X2 [Morus notabilis]|uniref:uncharacterized protein At2g29880-like isoform X2 n=1 Tax=Morus notabilis TaxID=981085 RepID=UPI000CED3987|nr:uncharacterized protein At2g29880-like isoform X2 [Morus notabilis]